MTQLLRTIARWFAVPLKATGALRVVAVTEAPAKGSRRVAYEAFDVPAQSDEQTLSPEYELAAGAKYVLSASACLESREDAVYTSLELVIEDSSGNILAAASDHTHAEPAVRLSACASRILQVPEHETVRVRCRVTPSCRDSAGATGLHRGGRASMQVAAL